MVGDFLKPLSEPFVKLIDSISGAVGVVYEPKRIRRKAAADSDAAIILARGQAEVDEIQFRAVERLRKLVIRRQNNIESIIEMAFQELPESVSENPVAEDWVYDFFEQCHDVSNEQMQMLWSRILAGEVAQPGSFSLRTLSLVKTLAPHDAERFTTFCELVWIIEETPTPIYPYPTTKEQQTRQELKFDDFLDLESSGLIKLGETTEYGMDFDVDPLPVSYQGQCYSLT
ncbi:MAG: DUF2806 domain-containing protein, partial [Chloroflexi bacterium]|nr:DUF2806 domain-containing protein [Chloroflexota bacterium]